MNQLSERYLEDFLVGQTFGSGRLRIDGQRALAFAAEFDPQPFHLDEAAARRSIFGGLTASGWHTAAVTMRLLVESELNPAGGIVGAGLDECRWPRPVRPGDELHVECEVIDVRPSKSRPAQGLIKLRTTTLNQNDEAVLVYVVNMVVQRRGQTPQEENTGTINETSSSQSGPDGTRRQFFGLTTAAGAALLATTAPTFAAGEAYMLEFPPVSTAITPWNIKIPQAALDDLKHQLRNTRYPEKETIGDTSQGPQLGNFMALVDYWRSEYDWRRCERMLNGFPQFRTEIDGLGIHFIHLRSRHENALPMILTHGWPGSIVEFYKTIEPLVNPTVFGGDARDAFHVVIPSLPGFGFSDKPTAPGWNVDRIAMAWDVLMKRLGYNRYVGQGGDWGAVVTTRLAEAKPDGLAAIHLNLPIFLPPPLEGAPTEEENAALTRAKHFFDQLSGYSNIQKTRPQTIGYALTDSPIAQAAWIYDRFITSTGSDNHPEEVLTRDEMLDDIMIYWLTGTAASSARLYWESFKDLTTVKLDIPVGCTIFPGDVLQSPRVWAERTFSKLIYWHRAERGGHFAALEQPKIFVREVRDCFRSIRS